MNPYRARLLVVDDEGPQLEALSEMLRLDGHEVQACASGPKALEALRRAPARFEVLLTDLRMPGMDGLSLLQQALQVDVDLMPVLMTAHSSVETAVAALKSGAFDYVIKPFRMDLLRPVISRALETRHLRRDARQLKADLERRSAQLEAANRELDAFAARAAHDLRSPVQQMVAYAGLLQGRDALQGDAESAHLLNRLTSAGQRADTLIDDLLRFARLGDAPIGAGRVRLDEVVEDARSQLAPLQAGRHVQWRVHPLPVVRGDHALLTQAFVNLLDNAIKFSAGRDPALIEVDSQAAGCMHALRVRDNGVGFDPAHAHRLFGAFERLHSQREFPGNGMGLANVRRIVERHGGSVAASSQPGEGACFTLQLPAFDDPA